MAGVIALGECMVELSLAGEGTALVGYAGDTFNTAVYLQRLGAPTAYATALGGGDPFTRGILAKMAEEGMAADLVVEAKGRVPGLYAIQRDAAGERSFYYWRGEAPARDYLGLVDVTKLAAALMAADLVYLSAISLAVLGDQGRAVLIPLLREAARGGVAVAFDTNYRPRLWPEPELAAAAIGAVIETSRYLSVSSADVAAWGDPAALARGWAARGVEVVLRYDDRRIEVMSGDRVEAFPAEPPIPVLDTTGAGDAFNAGYLARRLKGRAPGEAVSAGRRLASAVVQHPGAIIPRTAMPDLA
ncbi:sugar kinase [Phenylobacterium sp.]|jgi:2-dehydro-3-deoxygluconokinase|uniref:sugar kinase n=1 Tax=Phenylobacterium sp. TaxID=1871053 RepID=UPI002F420D19